MRSLLPCSDSRANPSSPSKLEWKIGLPWDGAVLDTVRDPSLTEQLGILTPPESAKPSINGADIWGVRPGHPVIFRVATSGERPMRFSAKGLPQGVTLDEKGVLRGVAPEKPGDYDIEVTAENAKGRCVHIQAEVQNIWHSGHNFLLCAH